MWPGTHHLPRQFSSTVSLSEGRVAEQIFGSDPQDPLSMYPCPRSSGSGFDVQGDQDKRLSDVCNVPHTATGHMQMPCSNDFSRKKRKFSCMW